MLKLPSYPAHAESTTDIQWISDMNAQLYINLVTFELWFLFLQY